MRRLIATLAIAFGLLAFALLIVAFARPRHGKGSTDIEASGMVQDLAALRQSARQRDSQAAGRNQTDANLKLRYVF